MRNLHDNNRIIRDAMKEHGVLLYEVADLLQVSEPTICRWFRHELPEDEQKRIVSLIEEKAAK